MLLNPITGAEPALASTRFGPKITLVVDGA
jgi:hypothetical protein